MKMTFEKALATKEILEINVKLTSTLLKAFPKSENGMTPDDVKMTEAFQVAKKNHNKAHYELRKFNKAFLNNFKDEYRTHRHK